jgi:hypothetical protein
LQVRALPPSSSSIGGVERGLDSGLQPLLVSLSHILKEAVPQEDREDNTGGSSPSDEMSANIASPPSGPGIRNPFDQPAGKGAAGAYTPTSPSQSPPPRS